MTAHSAPPIEGGRIGDRYQLEELVGEGGMARVWRAKDLTLERHVAVKFLFLREGRHRATMLGRFLREAQIAAAIRHPNVVDILDFGTTEDGRPYMVMELLVGETLEQRLARNPALTLEELVGIASDTLAGLAAVHKAGIIHRDLKPDNIYLLAGDDGGYRPKLLDFGVSRDNDPTSGRRSGPATGDGFLVGTPEYMSPEQARGLKDLDWRTDLYSFGVVLYEALSGRLPYQGDAVGDLIIDIVGGNAPSVESVRPDVGRPLSDVVARAMATAREDRWQSAKEMRDALIAAADESLGLGVRRSLPTPVQRRAEVATIDAKIELEADQTPKAWSLAKPSGEKRARWPWALAAATVAAVGVAWLAAGFSASPPPAPRAISAPLQLARPAPPPAPIAPVAPAPEPTEVTVTLDGVPENARVRVDDAEVEAANGAIRLARDERPHEIAVEMPGRTWRTTHVANGDGTYAIPRAARARAPEPRAPEPQHEGVIRDLDY